MTLKIEVRAKSGKNYELYQTLQALLPTMRKEPGCLGCRVTKAEVGDRYVLTSDWEHKQDFESYMRSISGSAMLGAIDLLAESSRIRMGSDAGWETIDALERMSEEA